MDDFGTGYATLTNLQQLPIDFLKIDRSFVITLKHGANARDHGNAIVAAIAQIGQTLDLETIAEGVETEEQAELLREFGCPFGQGFQFARPAPSHEITRLLTRPNGLPLRGTGLTHFQGLRPSACCAQRLGTSAAVTQSPPSTDQTRRLDSRHRRELKRSS